MFGFGPRATFSRREARARWIPCRPGCTPPPKRHSLFRFRLESQATRETAKNTLVGRSVSADARLGSRARSPSSGGGHASPCVIAARRAALLDAMAPCVADDLAPRRGGLVPSPSNGARASGLRLDGVGREASWLTTRRSYGVTGLSGEANGCFRELEVARTASMAAGSMGAALPEPSCGIDPTSPGLDEQLPITRPVKTGPRPRKRSASGTSGVPEGTGGSTPRVARGVAHAEARLARVPTQVQRPSPRARAVLKRARLCGRCPALSTEKYIGRVSPACAFDVSVL